MSNNNTRVLESRPDAFWILGFFIVTVNTFLAFLLFEYVEILYVALGLTGVLAFITMFQRVKVQKSNDEVDYISKRTSLRDLLWISRKYIVMNKKFIFTSVLGLIIAVTVISQAVLFSASYKQDSFDQFVETADTRGLEFTVEGITNFNTFTLWQNSINNNIQGLLNDFDYILNFTSSYVEFEIALITGGVRNEEGEVTIGTTNFKTSAWNEKLFNFLRQFPTFDKSMNYDSNQSIVVIGNDEIFTKSITQLEPALILTDKKIKIGDENTTFSSIGLNETYVWKISNVDLNYYNKNIKLISPYEVQFENIFDGSSILVSEGKEWDLYQTIKHEMPFGVINANLEANRVISEVVIVLPDLKNVNLLQMLSGLEQLQNVAESWAYSNSGIVGYEIDVQSPLRNSIENYIEFIGSFNVILFLVSGLLASVSLFLVYYSLTLVEQRKIQLIAIMKNRGVSKSQLRFVLFSEAFIGALVAIIIGMYLSVPWTELSLKTSGILEFDRDSIPLTIPSSWYWRVPLIGLIISFDIHIRSVLSLSKITVEEGDEKEEKQAPFWQRAYLDVLLVVVSILFWLIIRFIPIRNELTYDFLVETFSPTMMIVLVIGAPLIFARYFSDVVSKLSDFLWKFQGGITALATRNMRKNKFSISKLASLLMIGIMLTFLSIITPTTLVSWGKETTHYDLGSDIYVQGLNTTDSAEWAKLDISGIEAKTEIAELVISGGPFTQYSLLGIDPKTFHKAAYWDSTYDSKSLETITSQISSNVSIGTQSKVLKALGLKINDKLSIPISNDTFKKSFVLDVMTKFNFFPNLISTVPVEDRYGNFYPTDLPLLVSLDLISAMEAITGGVTHGAYLKISDGTNLKSMTEQLREIFKNSSSVTIQNLEEAELDFFEVSETKILISSLQGMLVVTLIVSMIAIGFFSVITLAERKKEIGVLRALGMVRLQIFKLLMTESLILVLASVIVGGALGSLISLNLLIYITLIIGGTTQKGTVPTLRLNIPWGLMSNFSLTLVLLTILVSAIPSQRMAMKETGNILRED